MYVYVVYLDLPLNLCRFLTHICHLAVVETVNKMPGKKKKQGSRPVIQPQDSMRQDIEAARAANLETISSNESGDVSGAGDGLDIADQLLATLNARDQAAADTSKAQKAEDATLLRSDPSPTKMSVSNKSGENEHSRGDGSSSASPRKGSSNIFKEAGEKIFGHHSSKSPPPTFSDDSEDIDGNLSTDMARRGSIRERIFGSSPSKEDTEDADGGKRKVSRQKARKVRR
jgi:hypothetical protein